MDIIVLPLLGIFLVVIDLYMWVVIISAVLSWLVVFGVVNTSNRFIYLVGDTTSRLTEPLLRPIRSALPNLSGIDLSPLALILGLIFLKNVIHRIAH